MGKEKCSPLIHILNFISEFSFESLFVIVFLVKHNQSSESLNLTLILKILKIYLNIKSVKAKKYSECEKGEHQKYD